MLKMESFSIDGVTVFHGDWRDGIADTPDATYDAIITDPPGGIILDPFAGSGTTGVAALHQQRQCIMYEKELQYFDLACKRLEAASKENSLFREEKLG